LATELKLSYRAFFLAVAASYKGEGALSGAIRGLACALEEGRGPKLEGLKRRALELSGAGYVVVVLDCLGLPELYWLYAKLRSLGFEVLAHAYVNPTGRTSGFLREFEELSMRGVARLLGGSKGASLDRAVHGELGEPASLEALADKAERLLKLAVEGWVDQLSRAREPFFVVSDHGYDFAQVGEKWYLVHGRDPNLLSKLAPLLAARRR
jgi:hypothetical protein